MKKLILISFVLFCSLKLSAQTNPDGVIMKDNRMMVVKSGKMMTMNKDIMLSNGTKIMTDGTVVKKDGSKMKLKNGDYKDMSGNAVKNMYFVPNDKIKKDNVKYY